jgi:hypothetical protein
MYTVVCCKFLLSKKGEEIVGTIMLLRDELRRTIRRTSERLVAFKSEAERVEGLEILVWRHTK